MEVDFVPTGACLEWGLWANFGEEGNSLIRREFWDGAGDSKVDVDMFPLRGHCPVP